MLYSLGIIHADIKPENMLLDGRLGLRIIDMSGSSISGKSPLSLESTRFFLPRCRTDDMPCSVVADLFALGSSFYQIITGRQPYAELNDKEVEMRFGRKDFPSVSGIPFGDTIRRCWRSSARRNSQNACSSGQSGPQCLEPYSFLIELSPNTPNFEETPTVAIEQGEQLKRRSMVSTKRSTA